MGISSGRLLRNGRGCRSMGCQSTLSMLIILRFVLLPCIIRKISVLQYSMGLEY